MTDGGLEPIGTNTNYVGTGETFSEQEVDDAREKQLRARLIDHAHPLTNTEWHSIQTQLSDIKARREARAYVVTKQKPPEEPQAWLPGNGIGIATLLAVRSGIMLTPPTTQPTAPTMVPLDQIRSGTELAHRIADERAFLASPQAKQLPPMFRSARQQYLADLNALAQRAIAAWVTTPEGRAEIKRRLYAELGALGDRTCRPGDDVETLVARRNTLLAQRARAANEEVDSKPAMGLDGQVVPNAQAYSDYVVAQYVDALGGGGTGIGQALGAIQVIRGGGLDGMRAAARAGQQVEGMGGGKGMIVDAQRRGAPNVDSTTRPTRGQLPHRGNDAIPKMGSRTVRNSKLAFTSYLLPPALATKYPAGVRFNASGHPDLAPYARKTITLPNLKGDNSDFNRADKAAGFSRGARPSGFSWHHHEDGVTLQLVPTDLHRRIGHTGGCAAIDVHARGEWE